MCDLKAVQMKVHHSLIQQLIRYLSELGRNAAAVTKNVCCAKKERAANHSTVTKWTKKFRLGSKNFYVRTESGGPTSVDSKAVLHAVEANTANCRLRVSGAIPQFNVVRHLQDSGYKQHGQLNCSSCY